MTESEPILNVTRGTVVCEAATLADRPLTRMKGLLGRSSLGAGEGLLLHPAPSVHTAFMQFPIDAVFLNRDSIVVRVVGDLAPWRMASAHRARSVLELAAGETARRDVRVGDRLVRAGEQSSLACAGDRGAGSGGVRPGRLLLVSRDRRFRAVMGALLSARGFVVTMATHYPEPAVDGVPRSDVVVIDAGDSIATAERVAARSGLITREVAVVFVGDRGGATTATRVMPKWHSFEQLCDEIELARRRAFAESEELRAPPRPRNRGEDDA